MDPKARFSIKNGAAPEGNGSVGDRPWDSGPEAWIVLSAAFLGEGRILALREGSGVWHASAELQEAQKRELEAVLLPSGGAIPKARQGRDGTWLLEMFPFGERSCLGRLFVLAQSPEPLTPGERAGLQRLVTQLGAFVPVRSGEERRSLGRGPSGASFVPGLVHELRNFIFGISASLDAFEARFRGQEEVARYQTVIRKSLERLGVFIDELREYGDPGRRPWAEVSLESILREAREHHMAKGGGREGGLLLRIEGALPRLRGDEAGLRLAFIHLMDLALQAQGSSTPVEIMVWAGDEGGRSGIHGRLEVPLDLGDLDPERLFEPFYFRPASLGRLALPVARRILEAHGGELLAGPRAQGGVEIQFTLSAI